MKTQNTNQGGGPTNAAHSVEEAEWTTAFI